jgi:hypothetical protein
VSAAVTVYGDGAGAPTVSTAFCVERVVGSKRAFDFTAPYLHMGIAVQGATDFEIEFVEVLRSGFAGIRLINPRAAGEPATPMANVRVHNVSVWGYDVITPNPGAGATVFGVDGAFAGTLA